MLEQARQEDIDRQKEMAGSLMGWLKMISGGPPGAQGPEGAGPHGTDGTVAPPGTQAQGSHQAGGAGVPSASASKILSPLAGSSGPASKGLDGERK
jgi:hypothetical protein